MSTLSSNARSADRISPLPSPGSRAPRRAAERWATDLLACPDLIFLDTETTGLDGGAEIIEIAVLDASGALCNRLRPGILDGARGA